MSCRPWIVSLFSLGLIALTSLSFAQPPIPKPAGPPVPPKAGPGAPVPPGPEAVGRKAPGPATNPPTPAKPAGPPTPGTPPVPPKLPTPDELVKGLDSKDPTSRDRAADELEQLGHNAKPAVPALIKALGGDDESLQWHVARAIGAIGPGASEAVPTLTKLLESKSPTVRANAALALANLGDAGKTAIPQLAKLAVDPEVSVRRAAMQSLHTMKPGKEVMVPLMIGVFKETEPSVLLPALQSLAEMGDAAVPALIDASKTKEGRYWACLALGEIGPAAKDAVPALKELVSAEEPEIRLQAIIALGQIGPDAAPAAESVTKALSEEQTGVRYAAAFALGKMQAKDAVKELAKTSESKDSFLRMLGAWAIAKIQPDDKEAARRAVEQIVELLKSKEPRLRQGAAVALTELHAPAEIVGPALEEMMQDSDEAVRACAIKAVGSMGAKAVPGATKALKNPKLREAAVQVLTETGPLAEPAVPDLIALLSDPDAELRGNVQLALAGVGPKAVSAVPALVRSLTTDKQVGRVKYTACVALGRIGPGAVAAIPSLEKGLKSEDPVLRLACVWAMFRIKPSDKQVATTAIPLLITGLNHEKEAVRVEVATALGDIGPMAVASVPALTKSLQDSRPVVRAAAEAALKKIQPVPNKS